MKNIGIFLKDEDEEDEEEPERPVEEAKPEMFGRGKRSAVIENKLRVSCPVGDVMQGEGMVLTFRTNIVMTNSRSCHCNTSPMPRIYLALFLNLYELIVYPIFSHFFGKHSLFHLRNYILFYRTFLLCLHIEFVFWCNKLTDDFFISIFHEN